MVLFFMLLKLMLAFFTFFMFLKCLYFGSNFDDLVHVLLQSWSWW
jgi:hypothetical protein